MAECEYKNFYAGFVPRYMKLNALREGRMFEITVHEYHLKVDQILHTIVYLTDVQNIYTRCLKKKNCEKRPLASSCMSVRQSARNNSAPTTRIFIKFGTW
jgi:hypothetical protein